MDWGGFREQIGIKSATETFLDNNYTVINFDATNSVGESGGKYENATLQKHYEDLVDVVSWAKIQTWYKETFVLFGHSMGGYAVLQYAEDYPEEVKGVFAFAPVITGELSFEAHRESSNDELVEWERTGWTTRESKSKPGLIKRLPWSHMQERLNHDLLKDSDKLNMKVALFVGEEDKNCPPKHQKIFFNKLNCEKDLYIITDAPHTFRAMEDLNELKKCLNLWLQKF